MDDFGMRNADFGLMRLVRITNLELRITNYEKLKTKIDQ